MASRRWRSHDGPSSHCACRGHPVRHKQALRGPASWPGSRWLVIGIAPFSASRASKPPPVTFYWIVEHVSTISVIPLAIVGFGITWWQIHKTRTAAEAARDAARDTQHGIGRGSLLVLIPQLQRTEEELERAVRSGHHDIALSWLGTWRWQAGQLRGLINVTSTERDTLKSIQESVVAAADAKAELIASAEADLVIATQDVRTAIAAVTNELGELAVVQGMQIGQSKT
jgi:hypothetical protein